MHWDLPAGRDPAEIEGNVAAFLWDLIDSRNEGNDRTTYPGRYVWTGVPNLVWCLENRVDMAAHRARFPRAPVPSTPIMLREYASEPSNWNADHIRSTWVQNLGRPSG